MVSKVKFQPSKRLFIDTLTKDITVHDCILDLVDNAVDSYSRHDISETRDVIINFDRDKDHFAIRDNCGGISLRELTEIVFRPGFVSSRENSGSIGMYGIGLKRALFKLGQKFTFETDDGSNHCRFSMDVQAWENDPDQWTVDLELEEESRLQSSEAGYTAITVRSLRYEAFETLTQVFEQELTESLGVHYTLFLSKRISICVNGVRVRPVDISIKTVKNLEPASWVGEYDAVKMKIICWIAPPSPKRPGKYASPYGWNIFMNDRLILRDDTTAQTGWTGDKPRLPKFHTIYYEFRGLVFLNADDPSRLPIDTGKTRFEQEHRVYRYVLDQMVKTARPLIDYLSAKYGNAQEKSEEVEEKALQAAASSAQEPVEYHLDEFNVSRKFAFKGRARRKNVVKSTRISYLKPDEQVNKLKRLLKAESNKDVGSRSFDYTYHELAGEDE